MEQEQAWAYAEQADGLLCKETKIPSVHFKLTDSEPDIFTSKVGGIPYLPHDAQIPLDSRGRQMKLLAQFDCTLLHTLPDYPHEGMLQFWLTVQYPWEEWHITYHRQTDRTVTAEEVLAKTAPFIEGETGEFPVIDGGYGIEPEIRTESMSPCDERYGKLMCKYLYDLSEGSLIREWQDIDDLFDPRRGESSGHKLGGYQYDPQSWLNFRYEPDFDAKLGAEDERLLLFQLEYDHHLGRNWREGAKVIIGDCGVMHFFIQRSDLKALAFDKADFNWNCS